MKRFVNAVLSSALITLFPAVAFAAEAADGKSRGEQISDLVFNIALDAIISTILIRLVLGGLLGIELEKRGTIVLGVVLLVIFALLLVFFPQVPIPKV